MTQQLTTFRIEQNLFGVDVQIVQEITKNMKITPVPLAPNFIRGLINLRGQIATAIGLNELFHIKPTSNQEEKKFVICRTEKLLLALIVDDIGDVIDIDEQNLESTPDTVSEKIKDFLSGVYKLPDEILSIINIETICDSLDQQ